MQRKIALAQKQPPVIPQRFWEQRTVDVVHGHLAQDLRKLEKYMENTFGNMNELKVPIALHEEIADLNMPDKILTMDNDNDNNAAVAASVSHPPQKSEYTEKVHTIARKDTISFVTPSNNIAHIIDMPENHDSELLIFANEEEEEHKDNIDPMVLQKKLQNEMRDMKKLRAESKQKRYEYQLERFAGECLLENFEPPK